MKSTPRPSSSWRAGLSSAATAAFGAARSASATIPAPRLCPMSLPDGGRPSFVTPRATAPLPRSPAAGVHPPRRQPRLAGAEEVDAEEATPLLGRGEGEGLAGDGAAHAAGADRDVDGDLAGVFRVDRRPGELPGRGRVRTAVGALDLD